jgi:hypothetical protein
LEPHLKIIVGLLKRALKGNLSFQDSRKAERHQHLTRGL